MIKSPNDIDRKTFNKAKRECEKGNQDFIEEYAYYVRDGDFCDKNVDLAIEIFEEARAKTSSVSATQSIGFIYRDKQNYEKAFEYYSETNEHADNYFPLVADCHYYGIGISKNRQMALELYEQINLKKINKYCVQRANYMIGRIYLEGEIVDKSIEKARYYLELANEDNDHNGAQELLMILGRTKDLN